MKNRIFCRSAFALALLFTFPCVQGQVINVFAGNHNEGYTGDGGAAVSAECFAPVGIAADGLGNVYFCDLGNDVIRKVNSAGIIFTIAGTGDYGYSGDGGLATAAKINQPTSIAVDGSGNIYFTDDANNVVRQIATTGIISTIAGNGASGYTGDGFPATSGSLSRPAGVAVDRTGNVYIADTYNHAVRKVDFFTGKISTVAGTGYPGSSTNGISAVVADLNYPKGVAVDNTGNFYIVDQGNDVIRKVTLSTGDISTYAGTGALGYSGDGGYGTSADLNTPTEIAFDASNNLFIADYSNHVIRMERTDGVITTIAGNGASGRTGNGGSATAGELEGPYGVAVDHHGNVYITDEISNEVRVVGFTSGVKTLSKAAMPDMQLYPVPCNHSFSVALSVSPADVSITITDVSGRVCSAQQLHSAGAGQFTVNAEGLAPGCYLVAVAADDKIYHGKMLVSR